LIPQQIGGVDPVAQEEHYPKENTGQAEQLLLHVVDAVLTDASVVDFLSYQSTCNLRFKERPAITSYEPSSAD